jgi:uncharacterized repeat protein (TIGR01451 family)
MATSISNKATLTYEYGTSSTKGKATSNIAVTTLEGPLTIATRTLEAVYRADDVLTYTISVKNTGSAGLTSVKVDDNLGTYAVSTTVNATPLTYLGPANLYINDVYSSALTPTQSTNADLITFTIGDLAAGATAMIVYKVQQNQYTKLVSGSSIKDTSSVTASGFNAPIVTDYTIAVDNYADLVIDKTMYPNPVLDGTKLTYTFVVSNYGNIDASKVELQDAFDTANAPTDLVITKDSLPFTDIDYTSKVLTIPKPGTTSPITLAKAMIKQDATTGVVSVVPTTTTFVVVGKI